MQSTKHKGKREKKTRFKPMQVKLNKQTYKLFKHIDQVKQTDTRTAQTHIVSETKQTDRRTVQI